jgi:DNA-binding NtrC family response regulator
MILLLDDHSLLSEAITEALRSANPLWEIVRPRNAGDAIARVIRDQPAVVLCAHQFSERSGVDLLAEIRALSPESVGILMADGVHCADLLSVIDEGAPFHTLAKPFAKMSLLADVADGIVENRRRLAEQQLADHLTSQGATSPRSAAAMRTR